MAKIEPFEKFGDDYDEWFNRNRDLYVAELKAIQYFIPDTTISEGLEVGVGTGRFAQPLGIKTGVDPSKYMAERARQRGIRTCLAIAEDLPFFDSVFDIVLMVTTICFVDDVMQSFKEAYRVLKPGGVFIVGFVDKESDLGRHYLEKKNRSRFYTQATFFTVPEVRCYVEQTGFQAIQFRQTLISAMPTKNIDGYGKGAFVVIKAVKKAI